METQRNVANCDVHIFAGFSRVDATTYITAYGHNLTTAPISPARYLEPLSVRTFSELASQKFLTSEFHLLTADCSSFVNVDM